MCRTVLVIFAFVVSMLSVSLAKAADPFTVVGVPVDATGANAIEAQTMAISNGQLAAAQIVLERVTTESDRNQKGLPVLTAETVAPLIRALEIANEKRSANRYLGDVTIAFNPSQVQGLLRSQGLGMITTQSRTRLVLPVLEGQSLWSENPWSNAWNTTAFYHALTPIRRFQPGEANAAIISASQAQALDMDSLRRIGQRFGVDQVLVARARDGLGGVTVSLTDVALDTGDRRNLGTFTENDFPSAAWGAVTRLENDWKRASVSLSQNAQTMAVSVLYRSHSDWLTLQDVINGSSQITDARLDAISKDGALMTITFGGDMNRLSNELAFKGVEVKTDPKLGTVIYRRGRL